jgi:hypothetical protein
MAYAINKLDGTTEFTITDDEWATMVTNSDAHEFKQAALPNGELVAMYQATSDNKDTILGELVTEHGADNVNFRLAIWSEL